MGKKERVTICQRMFLNGFLIVVCVCALCMGCSGRLPVVYTLTVTTFPPVIQERGVGGQVRINDGAWGDTQTEVIPDGQMVTVEARANSDEGYVFVGWYDDQDQLISTENPYTFVMSKDTTLVAFFVKIG